MPTGRLFFPGRGRLFFVDFSVIKARKLHETRCKAFPFESLVYGGLKTNHRDSEPEGPRIQSVTICHTCHQEPVTAIIECVHCHAIKNKITMQRIKSKNFDIVDDK